VEPVVEFTICTITVLNCAAIFASCDWQPASTRTKCGKKYFSGFFSFLSVLTHLVVLDSVVHLSSAVQERPQRLRYNDGYKFNNKQQQQHQQKNGYRKMAMTINLQVYSNEDSNIQELQEQATNAGRRQPTSQRQQRQWQTNLNMSRKLN